MKSLLDNNVQLGGKQSITGEKYYLAKQDFSCISSRGLVTSLADGKYIMWRSNGGTAGGLAALVNNTSQAMKIDTINGNLMLGGADYPPLAYANSEVDGVVTQTALSKATRKGYIKLGNGIIIQWGHINEVNGGYTETFATAFSISNPIVMIMRTSSASTTTNVNYWTRGESATNFNAYTSAATGINYIAIGY